MEVSEDARISRALSDDAVRDLVDLGDDVEALLGSPQDVEWALADDKFVILRSRPITSLYPLPEPAPTDDALHTYFSMGHQQAMPEALPPLVLDFWKTFGNASVRSIQQKPLETFSWKRATASSLTSRHSCETAFSGPCSSRYCGP